MPMRASTFPSLTTTRASSGPVTVCRSESTSSRSVACPGVAVGVAPFVCGRRGRTTGCVCVSGLMFGVSVIGLFT
jgi:hypothetical protein